MTCDDFWNQMPELAKEADPPDHVRECPACAARLEQHRSLASRLKQIADGRELLQPSPALEARLVEAFRNQASGRTSWARRYWLPWAVAAAALVILSVSLVRGRQPQRAQIPDRSPQQIASSAADLTATDSDFVPLPYSASEPADSGSAEDADLVRVEVPRSALVALGVPVPIEAGTGRVEAVVALGPDGMLQGIRVLQ
jgi:predicted anti-sigma-YlaC factor YlaD